MKKTIYFLILILAVSACQLPQKQKKVRFSGLAQGTYYAITYFDPHGRNLQQGIDSLLHAFDQSVSMWEPESVISKINRADSGVICDEVFIQTYRLARKVAEESNGAFDYTIGPLANAWGFGFKDRQHVDQEVVDSLLPLVDYRLVQLDGDRIRMEKEGMEFNFNAVAQGYSVDLVGAYLASKGIENYLVDIGGEVLARGSKPGQGPWKVGIEKPSEDEFSDRELQATVLLSDKALATSGNYRKFFVEDGVRYSHTLDPQTGFPVTHSLLSVSVLADDCGTADAWATAFMVMGLDKAKKILQSGSDLEAFFIYSDESGNLKTYASHGMKKILEN